MRKRSLLATFAVAAALVAGACGGSTGSTVTGATLLIGDYQDADSLNPFFYSTVMSSNIVGATHDGLLRLNEKLELEPWMAEEAPNKANGGIQVPGVGGDAATVTWKLRAWKWSDGVDLTCADYQYAREWILDPKNTAVSKVGTEDISAIDCNGNTMVVHYSKIYANLKYGPAVAPKHYFSKYTVGSVLGGNPATDVSNDMLLGAGYRTKDLPNAPTSGAFKYESRTTGVETVIVRNPYWKDPRNGKQAKLARLKYVVCGSPETCTAKFRTGELDMVTDLDGSQYAPTLDLGDAQRTLPAFTVEFLRPNFSTTTCSDGAPAEADIDGVLPTRAARGGGCPASELAIRQAIAHVVNRQGYLDQIEGGTGFVATNTELPAFFFYKDLSSQVPADNSPELAKSVLAAAGWVDSNNNGIVDKDFDGDGDKDEAIIDFCTTMKPTRGAKLQLLVAALKDVGIKGIVDQVGSGTLFGQRTDIEAGTKCNLAWGSYDVALHAFGITSVEPSGYDSYHSTQTNENGGGNDQFVNIPALDAALEGIKVSVDPEEQKTLMSTVQDLMAANTVVIPLHYWLDITLVSANVSGYLPHQAWGPIWNAYELDVAAAN
jgi:peptide/nickel transport system substrate-binding protein